MEELELRTLILRGEDSTLQFKERLDASRPCDELAKEMVAFLNKRGGTILIGVADDGKITGLSQDEVREFNQNIGNTTDQHVVPRITVDTENVVTSDGLVIVLTILEGIDKPYQTNKGAFYVKTGSDKRHVTHRDELRRLFQIGSHVYAEQQELTGSKLDQLDLDAYRSYFQTRFKEDAPEDDEEIIDQMRAVSLAKGDRITLAGALLFTKHPQHLLPQFTTKAVWFDGTNSAGETYRDDRHIEGTLPQMYESSMNFLDGWNSRQQPSESSFNEQGHSRVHHVVFEEILTNAFIHRDYFIQDSIKVFIFDDRLEISSPGTLPNSLTLEEATLGIRRTRNPLIENIGPFLMKYKGLGTGLKRARQLCPSIQFDNDQRRDAFIVTIPV